MIDVNVNMSGTIKAELGPIRVSDIDENSVLLEYPDGSTVRLELDDKLLMTISAKLVPQTEKKS